MKIRRPTIEGATLAVAWFTVAAISLSDSVAGMLARVAVFVPLAWADLISAETLQAIATWHLF